MSDNEQRYFDALKRIASYETVERLRRTCEKDYGLDLASAVEMAYENVIQEAKSATHGRRRPSYGKRVPK